MNFKKLICLCLSLIICFVFISCSASPSSFKEVYEKGSLHEQISFAMQNDLFAQQGFTVETTKYHKTATKTFDEVEVYYDKYLSDDSYRGGIKCKISDNILSIEFFYDHMGIRLSGEKFSYLSNVTYNLEPISKLWPEEDNINLHNILDMVDIKEINSLCNLYTEVTEAVMADIYKTVSTE